MLTIKKIRVPGVLLTGMKLAFALACLAFFLSQIVSTYAFVTCVTEDTIADFEDGDFYFTGLNSVDNTVRLLPIGLTGDWTTDRALPDSRSDLAAVAYGGRIFVFGGYTTTSTFAGNWRPEIYSATVQSDGTLSPWVHIGDLPRGVRGHRVVMTGTTTVTSTAYVLGGEIYDTGARAEYSSADVYQVVFDNATGAVVSVVTRTNQLPVEVGGLHYHSAVINGDKVYLIGGVHFKNPYTAGDIDYTSAGVHVATISANGELGDWTSATASLPTPLRSSAAVLYPNPSGGDTIYVMGGTQIPEVGAAANPTLKVYYGDITASGDITSWTESGAGNLPVPVLDHAGVIVNSGELFVIGGRAGEIDASVSTTVKSALVAAEDPARIYNWCGVAECDRWQGESGEALVQPRSNLAAVYYRSNVYVLGGNDANEESQKTVYRGTVSGNPRYRYAPSGYYESSAIDLGEQVESQVKGLSWRVYLTDTSKMTMTLSYRFWNFGAATGTWTRATPTEAYSDTLDGFYVYTATINSPITTTRYVQYRADMRSISNTLTPRLDWVRVYFDVPDPDVQVFKVGRDGVHQGDVMSYTVHYTVTGGMSADNVVLTETVPANSRYSASGWNPVDGDIYTKPLGTLVNGTHSYPGAGVEYAVVVTTTMVPDPVLTNVVRIGYPPMQDAWGNLVVDPDSSNNTFTTTTAIYQSAWALSKSVVPTGTVHVSDTLPVITYTLRYTYTGNYTEDGAVINDVVDLQAFHVITPYGNSVLAGNVITWTGSSLGPQQSGVVSFTAQLTRPLDNGYPVINRASIKSAHADVEQSNPVTLTVISTPTLAISKVASRPAGDNVFPGQTLVYTITVTNTGGMNATNAVVTDAVSAYLTDTVAYGDGTLSDGVLSWAQSPLRVDTPWVVTYTSRVGQNSGVVISNTASVFCTQKGPISTDVLTHNVPSAPVLTVSKTDGFEKATRGQVLTYTITYGNMGVSPAAGVRLTERVTGDVTLLGNSDWQTCAPAATCRYIDVGALDALTGTGTVTFVVQVKLDASLLKTFTNTVEITDTTTAIPATARDSDLVFVAPDVRLVSKSNGRQEIGRGEVLTYTLTYQNPGVTTTTGIILSDTLPAGLTYLGGTPSWTPAGGSEYWASLGDLDMGQTGVATMTVQVNPDAVAGPLTNTATLYVAEEVNVSDNTAQAVNTLRTPALRLVKTDDQSFVKPGDFLTYTIGYSNTGYVAADVVLTETLPGNLRYVGYGWQPVGGNVYTRALGSLAVDESGSLLLFAQVDAGATPGPLTNTVRISAPYADYPTGNVATDTTTVLSFLDLAVSVNDGVGGVHPNDFITYTIVYTNSGNVAIDGVAITDTLAGGLSFQGGTCSWTNVGTGQYGFSVGALDAGEPPSACTLVAQAPAGAQPAFVTNTVRIGGSLADDLRDNDVYTDVDFITGTTQYSDLYVATIDFTPVTPTVGANTTFVVTVTNLGPGEADDLVSQALETSNVIGTFRLAPPLSSELQALTDPYEDLVYVGLYIDPYREPAHPTDNWFNFVGYLSLRGADGKSLKVGDNRSIKSTWAYLLADGETYSSYGPATYKFASPGRHSVTAQVDMYFKDTDQYGWRPSFGHIPESNEGNNITTVPITVTAASSSGSSFNAVALPLIVKNHN